MKSPYWSRGYQEIESKRFHDNRHIKMLSFSVLHNGSIYRPVGILVNQFLHRLSRLPGHSAAGRIVSINVSSDTIGNRNRGVQAYSAQLEQTAAPCAPLLSIMCYHSFVNSPS